MSYVIPSSPGFVQLLYSYARQNAWRFRGRLRAYKAETDRGETSFGESVIYREMAHAEGKMTVYLELPLREQETWETLLRCIGYWGQASSFATCLDVREQAPLKDECAQPLRGVDEGTMLSPYFTCVLSEFRDSHVAWQEVVPFDGSRVRMMRNPLKLDVYLWPLRVVRQSGRNTLLIRTSFA